MSSSSLGDLASDGSHHVVVCRRCQSCLVPGGGSVERHLRGAPHRLLGEELKSLVADATALKLRDVSALKRKKPREHVAPLEQLQIQPGFRCLFCGPDDAFHTTHLPRMRAHVPSRHGRSAREHKSSPMWRSCLLQTYFTARALVD